uniref:Homeobox domain-containing protein n=1 Tax=Parastrongyloides trichosuri TaxID=131310 RepID=A0A0N4Z1Y4_PARTI
MEPCPVPWEVRKQRLIEKVKAKIRFMEKDMNISIDNDVTKRILEELNGDSIIKKNKNDKGSKNKCLYYHFDKETLRILENFYTKNKYPSTEDIEELSVAINATKDRIRVCYYAKVY